MKTLIPIILVAALAFGCTKEGPVEVNLLDACAPANGGKVVTTSGYLGDKGGTGVMCSNPGAQPMTCGYSVLTGPDGEKVFSAFIVQGYSRNQAEKPEAGYKKEDIKIRDEKGSLISLSAKMRLTGMMTVLAERRGCWMAVDKIESTTPSAGTAATSP